MQQIEQPAYGQRLSARALDLFLPPRCLACGMVVDREGALCATCWQAIDFLSPPCCAACGHPFEFDAGEGSLCAACLERRPPYGRARAVMRYAPRARDLVLGFKHGDKTYAAPVFARWLYRAGQELLQEADLLVPVPLHWTRLFQRRFNQAGLLAQALSRLGGVPVAVDLLVRRRRTPSQGNRNPTERRRNVQGAFALRRGRQPRIEGKRILLIDDVMTTGATIEACAETLLEGGAAAVDALTLAHVVR